MLAIGGCSDGGADEKESSGKDLTIDTISLESALAMAEAEDKASRSGSDTEAFYAQNNALASDPEYVCNQGSEPLTHFVEAFLSDKRFRENRLSLPAETSFYTDTLPSYTLRVIRPDTTGFFASWHYVSADTAAFVSGWIDSEILEELTLARASSETEWRLVDYFSAL